MVLGVNKNFLLLELSCSKYLPNFISYILLAIFVCKIWVMGIVFFRLFARAFLCKYIYLIFAFTFSFNRKDTPLMNFIEFRILYLCGNELCFISVLLTCQRAAAPLFQVSKTFSYASSCVQMLRVKYAISLSRDASFGSVLFLSCAQLNLCLNLVS